MKAESDKLKDIEIPTIIIEELERFKDYRQFMANEFSEKVENSDEPEPAQTVNI